MKLLIVSTNQRLRGYLEFAEVLSSLGVEAACVSDSEYCFLGKSRLLHSVPFPRLLGLIKQFRPDYMMTDFPFYIPHMAKLVGQRVLFHIVADIWTETYSERAMHPSVFVRMYGYYWTEICFSNIKKADVIFPNSRWLEEQVKKHMPNHLTQVLYDGINARKWKPRQNSGDNKQFDLKHPAAVGIFPFNIYKKVSGLLEFVRIVKKMPDVNFYFAGNGPYLYLVKANCPSNMFLIGKATENEVKSLLESGDLFIHPSGLDALPRSVKEASLMEKPIVASDVGGIPEIVKDNHTGYLCKINNTEQWIEKIRYLLDNPSVARRFGRNAREFVMKKFDWKKTAEDFVTSLKSFQDKESQFMRINKDGKIGSLCATKVS
jgi:glycosyltransferase involved in cell wall biosynthesis